MTKNIRIKNALISRYYWYLEVVGGSYEEIILLLFIISFSVFFIIGCLGAKTDSTNVKTSGIYASYEVSLLDENWVKARAKLTVGGALGSDVMLSSGEKLYCNEVRLEKGSDLLGIFYEAIVPVSPDNYIFRFERVDGPPVDSVVDPIPDRPTITFPTTTIILDSGNSLSVTWDISAPATSINIYASSAGFGSLSIIDVADTGAYTIDGSNFAGSPTDPSGPSPMTLTVTRCKKRYLNSAFQGGIGVSKCSDKVVMTYSRP